MKPRFRLLAPGPLLLLAVMVALVGGWVEWPERGLAEVGPAAMPEHVRDGGRHGVKATPEGEGTPRAVAVDAGGGVGDVAGARLHARLRELRQVKTGDDEPRERLMQELLARLTDDTVAETVQSLSAEELDTPFGPAALERWLAVDIRGAASWLEAQAGATDEQVRLLTCRLLAEPAGLRAYCDQLPDTDWRQRVLNQAGLERIAADPGEAVALAVRMKAGGTQQNLLETAAYAWTGREPGAALAWMVRVEDATLREQLLAVGAKAIAMADPDLAAVWLDSAVAGGGRSEAALCVAELWAAQSPAEAANWAARLPATGPRAGVLDAVARRWLQVDADAANAWLRLLPERDEILARLSTASAESGEEI